MKKLILLFIVSNLIVAGYTQIPTCTIDKHYFLLGTLSDYMGYEKWETVNNRVDDYGRNSERANFMKNLFIDEYPDLKVEVNFKNGRYALYSERLSCKVDSCFDFFPAKRGVYVGDLDLKTINFDDLPSDFMTTQFDSVYSGKLKEDLFLTDEQKRSFLAGAYHRFGLKKDSIYTIKLANSTSKAAACVKLLKEMNLSNFKHESFNGIPGVDKIYFTPNKQLEKYFEVYYVNRSLDF